MGTRQKIIVFLLAFAFYLLPIFPCSAGSMSEIRQRGYLNIAVKENLRPLGFRDASGNLQGLEIDLAQRLALDLLGKKNAAKLQPAMNRDRLSLIFNNKVDLAIARVTATESRARLVNFSVPYYLDGTVLVTKDATLQRFSDFKQRKIAVLQGSSTIARVRYFIPNAKLVAVDSYEIGRSLLFENNSDAFAADGSVLSGWVQEYPQYRLLPTPLSTEPLCVVMPKGLQYDELRRTVNNAIAGYIASGWLKERAEYWGLPSFDLKF